MQAALGLEGLEGALNGPMGWVGRGLVHDNDTLQPHASGKLATGKDSAKSDSR